MNKRLRGRNNVALRCRHLYRLDVAAAAISFSLSAPVRRASEEWIRLGGSIAIPREFRPEHVTPQHCIAKALFPLTYVPF
jgi:hypothetical protein